MVFKNIRGYIFEVYRQLEMQGEQPGMSQKSL